MPTAGAELTLLRHAMFSQERLMIGDPSDLHGPC